MKLSIFLFLSGLIAVNAHAKPGAKPATINTSYFGFVRSLRSAHDYPAGFSLIQFERGGKKIYLLETKNSLGISRRQVIPKSLHTALLGETSRWQRKLASVPNPTFHPLCKEIWSSKSSSRTVKFCGDRWPAKDRAGFQSWIKTVEKWNAPRVLR